MAASRRQAPAGCHIAAALVDGERPGESASALGQRRGMRRTTDHLRSGALKGTATSFGGRQGARKAAGHARDPAGALTRMGRALKAKTSQFAANVLPIIPAALFVLPYGSSAAACIPGTRAFKHMVLWEAGVQSA